MRWTPLCKKWQKRKNRKAEALPNYQKTFIWCFPVSLNYGGRAWLETVWRKTEIAYELNSSDVRYVYYSYYPIEHLKGWDTQECQ